MKNFKIENGIISWNDGSCRTANQVEKELFAQLVAERAMYDKLNRHAGQLERELADMTTAATGLSDDLTRLGEQLAESQAREAEMREALSVVQMELGFDWLRPEFEKCQDALSIHTDDTALRQAIAKELLEMANVIGECGKGCAEELRARAKEFGNGK